jgi:cysteine desulfurase
MTTRAYLDWNATAPLRPEARAAAMAALDLVGNPSSIHGEGRAVRRIVEDARFEVAALVGVEPRDVILTSGGTEANALALSPAVDLDVDATRRERLLVSSIEHPSVRCGGRFAPDSVEEVPVLGDGRLDLGALDRRLERGCGDRLLVSIMLANNETGIIQPVAAAADLVHAAGGILHVDAVQAVGRIPCTMRNVCADLLTISGHKLGAPKGVGALVRCAGLRVKPLLRGGGQERSMRAGTENVAAIAGFGAAAKALRTALEREVAVMAKLRNRLERGIIDISPHAVIFGREVERLCNTTLVAVPDVKAETAVIALDLDGVAVSAGAACSSGKVQTSHVLAAMGIGHSLARGAIRISIGPRTAESEIDCFLAAWTKLLGSLHIQRGLRGKGGVAA